VRAVALAVAMGLTGTFVPTLAGAGDAPDATCPGPPETSNGAFSPGRVGQTFTALRSGPLTAASANIIKSGTGPAADYVFSINSVNSAGVPTNTKLANRVIPDSVVPVGQSTVKARFGTPPMLSAGKQYALVLSRPGNDDLRVGTREGDDCAGGDLYTSSDGNDPFTPVTGPPPEDDVRFDMVFTIFRNDQDPPQTTITAHPPQQGTRNQVSFKFRSSEPGSMFACKMDAKPYKPCSSPKSYRLVNGRHIFKVRATDQAGNTDPTPAVYGFKILPDKAPGARGRR
jgi:hypothetical protein